MIIILLIASYVSPINRVAMSL